MPRQSNAINVLALKVYTYNHFSKTLSGDFARAQPTLAGKRPGRTHVYRLPATGAEATTCPVQDTSSSSFDKQGVNIMH